MYFEKSRMTADVAALAGERGSAAAGEKRSMMLAAEGDGGDDIFFVARDDDADWDLAIVGAIGGVEGAAAGVETDFSAKMAAEGGFEGSGRRDGWVGLRCQA